MHWHLVERITKPLNRSLTSQSGGASILPIIVILMFSTLMVYSYMQVSQDSLVRIRSRRMAEEAVFHVTNQLMHRISVEPSSSCAFWTEIQSMRNLSVITPQAVQKVYSPVQEIPCILSASQALDLSRLEITVQPLSTSADLTNMGRLIRIGVKGISKGNHKVLRERMIRLSVASLGDNALVLTGSAGQAKLKVNAGATLHVYGTTYVTGTNSSEMPNLSEFGGGNIPYNNRIFFHDYVLTRGKTLRVSGDVRQSQMSGVFLRGIKTGIFNGVPLPTESYPAAWNQKIDYSVVYGDSPDSPLPEMPSPYTAVSGTGAFYNASLAATVSLPSAAINLTETSRTCGSTAADMSNMTPMVILQATSEVTIDFTKNPLSFKDSDVFCGLIRARKLNVIIRSGNQARLFGRFFVDEINVSGSGNLSIISERASNSTPVSLAPPLGFANLSRQMSGLQIFVGQPFFVPLAMNPATTFSQTPDLIPHPSSDYLLNWGCPYITSTSTCNCPATPSKPAAGNVCWPAVLSAPTESSSTSQINKLFASPNAVQNLVYFSESML